MTKPFSLTDIFGRNNSFFSKSFYVSNITFEYEIIFCSTFMNVFKNKNYNVKSRLPVTTMTNTIDAVNLRNTDNTNNAVLNQNTAVTNPYGLLCGRPDLYPNIVNINNPTVAEMNAL